MGKKLKGGRRQILQLEEKKPPKSVSKPKMKSLIHYSDSDDDSKKSNDSELTSSVQFQDNTPLDTEIADFFKEIDALSVPEELVEPPVGLPAKEVASELGASVAGSSKPQQDSPEVAPNEADFNLEKQTEVVQCAWQEICDDSTGYSYYWNMLTNEVTWDCPEEYKNYLLSLNSAETNSNVATKESNNKKSKQKKEPSVLPEGAIIPISYFGDSSSEASSDSEKDPPKLPNRQKNKDAARKQDLKTKRQNKDLDEKESKNEVFGPQLPPGFQFPERQPVPKKRAKENAEIGPFLPENFSEIHQLPKLNDVVAESSKSEKILEPSVNIRKDQSKNLEEQGTGKDTIVEKAKSTVVQAFRPVVDYDSFTDEDTSENESPSGIKTKSAAPKDEFVPKADTNAPQQSNVCDSETVMNNACVKPVNEPEKIETTDVKEAPSIKANQLKPKYEKLHKKDLKRKKVDIDSLFAAHSSYVKHGFGFMDRSEDEEVTSSKQERSSYRRPYETKAVSFVKSEQVLDLGLLNDASTQEVESDQPMDSDVDIKGVTSPIDDKCPAVEVEEVVEEIRPEAEAVVEEDEVSKEVPSDEESIEEGEIVEKPLKSDTETQDVEVAASPESLAFELTDDLDEIDKALCEALYKKKAQNQASGSVAPAPVETQQKPPDPLEKSSVKKMKTVERDSSALKEKAELRTRIVEMSSILIDKLTFLLSSSGSTLPSLNNLFVQLQTRFVDWQAGALDSAYFDGRLKEVNDYLLHYETSVVSGDWTCQWDRVTKRYFYLNRHTQFSQWNFPEELCSLKEPCGVSSEADPALRTPSSSVGFRSAPSPPPRPPGVDSPPPHPPRTPPPDTPPPPFDTTRARTEEDMDLENSNDSNSITGDSAPAKCVFLTENSSEPPAALIANQLSFSESRSLFPILTGSQERLDVNTAESTLEARTGIPACLDAEPCLPEATQPKVSRPAVKRKKTKIQPGLGLKKKNIPSLVEKWQKIKEEQEKEDSSSELTSPF